MHPANLRFFSNPLQHDRFQLFWSPRLPLPPSPSLPICYSTLPETIAATLAGVACANP